MDIDINNPFNYEYNCSDEKKEQTKVRLQQLIDLGCKEVGYAQYGIPNICSGIYIERVWSYTDENWQGEIEFIKKLKESVKD